MKVSEQTIEEMFTALKGANKYLAELAANGGPKQGVEGMDEWAETQSKISDAIRSYSKEAFS